MFRNTKARDLDSSIAWIFRATNIIGDGDYVKCEYAYFKNLLCRVQFIDDRNIWYKCQAHDFYLADQETGFSCL